MTPKAMCCWNLQALVVCPERREVKVVKVRVHSDRERRTVRSYTKIHLESGIAMESVRTLEP